MLIPALKTIIDKSSENGVDYVIMGMPHRCLPAHPPTLAPSSPVPSLCTHCHAQGTLVPDSTLAWRRVL